MPLPLTRWHPITESSFAWEQDALDFVRERLPDQEPYHAWSNFEFIADDGSVNEVDLLVLAPSGFFLVEIKSRPGVLDGDAHTWIWRDQGRETLTDNPLLLTNRKAKRLMSLLRRQRAVGSARLPFLEPLVFCAAPGLQVRLSGQASTGVRVRDKDHEGARPQPVPGIIASLTRPPSIDPGQLRIDGNVARVIVRALESAGIRRSQKARRVGDYELGLLLMDGPAYQDFQATHVAMPSVARRVRVYQVPRSAGADARRMIFRAAQREFQILEGINHPAILRATDYKDQESGPALIFEHHPDALRLDHFLRQHGAALSQEQRLTLLRQLAEAVRYAHEKHLVHRALGPQSVLVLDPASPRRRLQIFNWQVGVRESGTTGGKSVTATAHLEQLVEDETTIYLAPEALAAPGEKGAYLDVFSFGAIAYHLFAGQAPACSVVELAAKLREDRGLQLSAVVDGVGVALNDLVALSTHPDVSIRLATMDDVLAQLELVEEEMTRPDDAAPVNPAEARVGDVLPGAYKVKKRIGQGSISVVFLVETRDGRELVLKVASSSDHNERIRQEGAVLGDLRHQHIVALRDVLDVGGHAALLMDRAGEDTLASRLRRDGPLHLELLQRFGEDLLQTVSWLEQKGIPHRDIKPDNIGVAEVGAGNRLHLVLFDFSLARTSSEAIRAGTAPYLEPFLSVRKPPRWDVAAERFAAAMTLYEMATARLPQWADGRSDPALIEEEVTLESGLFDPDLRESMLAFFTKALRRAVRERFDNADDMLAAWRAVFTGVARPRSDRDEAESATDEPPDFTLLVAAAKRETPLAQIGLSTRALNALERARVLTCGDLVTMASRRLYAMAGVGAKTRAEIRAAKDALAGKWAVDAPVTTATSSSTAAEESTTDVVSIDLLMARLMPRRSRSQDVGELRILNQFLTPRTDAVPDQPWPTQTAAAETLKLTRARVSQVVVAARTRWSKDSSLTRLRADMVDLIQAHGGVMAVRELAHAVLALRGSEAPEPLRTVRALAVARAAVESERERKAPRFEDFRRGALLIATSTAAADYADVLGETADRLAAADPLLPPSRVSMELEAVDPPEGATGLLPARIVQLAAAASKGAAVSSRLELYPRDMPAARALRLAQGALLGAQVLTVSDLKARISGRYPDAEPLPDRPALDELLGQAGLELEWDPSAADRRGAYRPRRSEALLSSSSTFQTRNSWPDDAAAEREDVQEFDRRLRYALDSGSFLALGVEPKLLPSTARRLTRKYPVASESLEALLIAAMRDAATKVGADWNIVRKADAAGPEGPDWGTLLRLVRSAVPDLEHRLAQSERPLLLSYPGLLARYNQLAVLQRLQQSAGRPGGPPAVLVLVAADGQHHLPMIDGQALPVISSNQWLPVPPAWVQGGTIPHHD
ncbi:BREX system serine/threonine kinase PglW [Luteitalea sp.]|uniref:BREX system serine/threonine kinase PglW n=1 Tax=Luteitalea sp. TaxID=2004800 RepID=UPI0025BADE31|nr:BREX system serine/threonine kinase PglW [Luteitalea sp.]